MCTAIILVGAGGEGGVAPVVVAANRDEFYRRPAEGPVVLAQAGTGADQAVGGLDREQGGSWMGVTRAGFLALLINQPRPGGPLPGRRSRGELVVEALRRGRTDAARRWLAELDPRAYNPFNLLYGDAGGLEVAYGGDDARVEIEVVAVGLHVLPNGRLDQPDHPKVARAMELVTPRLGRPWPELACSLCGILGDHQQPELAALPAAVDSRFSPEVRQQLGALCVHTPAYGTRSAAVVALEPGRVGHYLWAPGPPCTTRFEDASVLFADH